MNYILIGVIAITSTLLIDHVHSGEMLQSERITNWGVWGAFQSCPNGGVVQAFRLRTEPYRGVLIDDTATNAVELYCGNPANPNTTILSSLEGHWGSWGALHRCREGGYIHGFQLRVEERFIVPDDETATNNIRFFCTNDPPEVFIEGDGLTFGAWRSTRKCARNESICGIQTQVQPDQLLGDDTAFNNIDAECCNIPRL